jgi:purine-binding chemotaxis protein CheW
MASPSEGEDVREPAADAEDGLEIEWEAAAKPRAEMEGVAAGAVQLKVEPPFETTDKPEGQASLLDDLIAAMDVETGGAAEAAVQHESEPAPEETVEPGEQVSLLDDLIAAIDMETEATSEAEVPLKPEPAPRADAEPEEQASLLDDLIATIDMGVEEAFGPGAMADLLPAAPVGEAGEEQHVIFSLAGTEYAAHIGNVTEIGKPLEATPVPNVPDWVLGVVNLRGDIISMVDMRAFLGMEPTGYGQDKRMLVAQARRGELVAGLVVDRVTGIRYLDKARIAEPAAPIEDRVAPYLRGVYEHEGHLLVALDFDRLLLSPEMRQV